MSAAPDVSVLVVNYRTPALTCACLASVARHCPQGLYEAVVTDNGSGDGSPEQLAACAPWARQVWLKSNLGFGPACNLAAGESNGRYLFLLNSDAELAEDSLTLLRDFLDTRPQAAAVGCRLRDPVGGWQPSAARFPDLLRVAAGREKAVSLLRSGRSDLAARLAERLAFFYSDIELDAPRPVDWCVGAALMIRRSAFEAVGGFDPRIFLYAEEMDLCLRLRQAGYEIWHTPGTHVLHRRAASSGGRRSAARLACIAAGHRYFYFKHHGIAGGALFCLTEMAASAAKAAIWGVSALLASGERRRARLDKAAWHAAYLRSYFARSY